MIKYDRLWKCMEVKGFSQYKLMMLGISHSTMTRLKNNQPVNVDTIDKLCGILDCRVEDIMEYFKTDMDGC